MCKAVEHSREESRVHAVHLHHVAQQAVHEHSPPHVGSHKQRAHEQHSGVKLRGRHYLMVNPEQRQQQRHEQRVAQGVPVETHTRDEYQREDIVARHIQVVVEHRPEAHVRTTCERLPMIGNEQRVERGEHYQRHYGYGAFLFAKYFHVMFFLYVVRRRDTAR